MGTLGVKKSAFDMFRFPFFLAEQPLFAAQGTLEQVKEHYNMGRLLVKRL